MNVMIYDGKIEVSDKRGKFSFNHKDITREVGWIVDAFIAGDFKRMGFIFGTTLDKFMS